MHTAELIPVLKALRADPSSHRVLADWFEDRGHHDTGEILRGQTFPSGEHAVRAVRGLVNGIEGVNSCSHFVHLAVVVEAFERVISQDICNEDWELLWSELKFHHNVRSLLGGNVNYWRSDMWHIIPHNPEWGRDRPIRHTCVSPDGLKSKRVTLSRVGIKWEPPVVTLCGGWLEVAVSAWVGTDPFTGRIIATKFHQSTAYDPVLREMPF